MKINVIKVTYDDLAHRACQFTLHSHSATSIPMRKLYGAEHSPIRTQMFWVELEGIPSYVSTHLVRHKIGVEHYVQTNRLDRGASFVADRNTSVNHAMFLNAQALINISRKRLCTNAEEVTRKVWEYVKKAVEEVDPDLAEFMVVDCDYRGLCYEPSCCGRAPSYFDVSTHGATEDKVEDGGEEIGQGSIEESDIEDTEGS